MRHTTKLSCSMANGPVNKYPSQTLTRSCFLWLLQHEWGRGWFQKHTLFRSDNEAVVSIVNARTSRVPDLMHLVRQNKFISLCQQLGKLHSSGSPCPADEWTLCLFATSLAHCLRHIHQGIFIGSEILAHRTRLSRSFV